MTKIILKDQPAAADVIRLSEELKIEKSIAVLLLQRGFSSIDDCKNFLYATVDDMCAPFCMTGMVAATDCIRKFIDEDKKITIFGDYDCDGIGATAILYLTLKSMGAQVSYFVPERKRDGYGISESALRQLFLKQTPNLIISVDCGISSSKEIDRAKEEYSVEFIITDHHELPEVLPSAILINPHFDKGTEFSGAGVALKLSEALIGRAKAMQYIDICALSTVADIVPLVGENRIIVKEGLKKFKKRDIRPGLKELLRVSAIDGSQAVTSYDIGFKLAPRINASGRLDSAEKSIELLIDEDVSTLRLIAEELNANNKARQDLTDEVFVSAKEKIKNYDLARNHLIILADTNWDAGVLGIAAARLAETFLRPVILLTENDGFYSGSARSVDGINLYEMLCASSKHLLHFGGHAAAAGMSIKKTELPAFLQSCREYLENYAEVFLHNHRVYADLSADKGLNVLFLKQLQALEPYGMGNPKPIFCLDEPLVWQRINTKPHLKAKLSAETEAVAFSKGAMLECWNFCGAKYAVSADISVYQNKARVSLFVKHAEARDGCLAEDVLLERYLRTHLIYAPKVKFTGEKRTPAQKFGQLLVAFTESTFLKAKQSYPNHDAFQIKSDTLSPNNALVLSPDMSTDFSYFNEIVFLEQPTDIFLQYVSESTAATIHVCPDLPVFPQISLEVAELREIYVAMGKILNGVPFTSTLELYKTYFENFISSNRTKFVLAFTIFEELGLIFVDKSSMMHINNTKIDLTQSIVYRSLNAAT